jgi:hypothetical protein
LERFGACLSVTGYAVWENGTVVLRASTVWLRGAKLWGGRIVKATIKAILEGGTRLPVSYRQETALIYRWQIVGEARSLTLERGKREGQAEMWSGPFFFWR